MKQIDMIEKEVMELRCYVMKNIPYYPLLIEKTDEQKRLQYILDKLGEIQNKLMEVQNNDRGY